MRYNLMVVNVNVIFYLQDFESVSNLIDERYCEDFRKVEFASGFPVRSALRIRLAHDFHST